MLKIPRFWVSAKEQRAETTYPQSTFIDGRKESYRVINGLVEFKNKNINGGYLVEGTLLRHFIDGKQAQAEHDTVPLEEIFPLGGCQFSVNGVSYNSKPQLPVRVQHG